MLKLQYLGDMMRRADSFEKTMMLGKIEPEGEGGDRGWDDWMASPTQWTSLSKLQEMVKGKEACCAVVFWVANSQRHDLATEQQHKVLFTLQSIKSAIALCLKNNNVHTLILKYFIDKKMQTISEPTVSCNLSAGGGACLHVSSCWLISMVVAEGSSVCGNF